MSDYKRADRVGELVQAELADILQRKIKDPRVGFATITGVKMSDDLKSARVFVSVLGSEKEKKDTIKGLTSAVHFIRGELGRKLKLRYMPELVFTLDESIERGAKMLALLDEIKKKEQGEE